MRGLTPWSSTPWSPTAAFDPVVLRKALNLPPETCPFAITPLGYPEAAHSRKGTKSRKPMDEVVTFV